MAFTLNIKTDNAAFGEDDDERTAEISRILRNIAARLDDGTDLARGTAYDINGNPVAEWVHES
jgi:hypothetical protein